MQQTENLKLNLIEGGDPVDWEVMNENAEKLEAAVTQTQAELSEGLAAVAAGLGSGGQNARIAWGSYTGNGKYGSGNPNSLTFDFVPVAVIIGCDSFSRYQAWPTVAIRGAAGMHCDNATGMTTQCYVTWTGSGLSWYNSDCASDQNNNSGSIYYYVALGYSA